MRFDSIKELQPGDTVLYNYRHARPKAGLPGSCTVSQYDTAWTGPRIVMKANNDDIYYNKWGDSILFATSLPVGAKIPMYTFSNGSYLESEVISEVPELLFAGLQDGVKTFRINAKTSGGADTTHLFDGKLFKISFGHGFKLAYNWWLFPTDTASIKIVGAPEVSKGVSNPDARVIFNIQPGNEFHYRIYNEDCGIPGCRKETILEKRFYLSRDSSGSGDTLSLSYKRFALFEVDDPVTGFDTFSVIDTQYQQFVFTNLAYLDGFNREHFYTDSVINTLCTNCSTYGWAYTFFGDTLGPRLRKQLFLGLELDTFNACFLPATPMTYDSTKLVYGDGLGLTYLYDTENQTKWRELEMVYYQKGIEVWGNPIDFSKVTHVSEPYQGGLKLFPNPARNTVLVHMDANESGLVELLDAAGRLILSHSFSDTQLTLDIRDLPRGSYVVRFSGAGFVATRQVIKM